MKGFAKRHTFAAVVGSAVALLCTAAFAYFASTFMAEGSHEAKTGEKAAKTETVAVNFAAGLTPDTPVPVTMAVENTSTQTAHFHHETFNIATPQVPQCAAWLELKAVGGQNPNAWNNNVLRGEGATELDVAPGTHSIITEGNMNKEGGEVVLQFNPETAATTNQSVCENTNVKVTAKLES